MADGSEVIRFDSSADASKAVREYQNLQAQLGAVADQLKRISALSKNGEQTAEEGLRRHGSAVDQLVARYTKLGFAILVVKKIISSAVEAFNTVREQIGGAKLDYSKSFRSVAVRAGMDPIEMGKKVGPLAGQYGVGESDVADMISRLIAAGVTPGEATGSKLEAVLRAVAAAKAGSGREDLSVGKTAESVIEALRRTGALYSRGAAQLAPDAARAAFRQHPYDEDRAARKMNYLLRDPVERILPGMGPTDREIGEFQGNRYSRLQSNKAAAKALQTRFKGHSKEERDAAYDLARAQEGAGEQMVRRYFESLNPLPRSVTEVGAKKTEGDVLRQGQERMIRSIDELTKELERNRLSGSRAIPTGPDGAFPR